MEEKIQNFKNRFRERMGNHFEESINSDDYQSEQNEEKLSLRKKKIFDILLSKRKENLEKQIKDSHEININELNCDDIIKKDVNEYIKTIYDVKKWFKYLFSSNKNDVYVALFLLRRYVELQLNDLDFEKRMLSRNDTELIQKLCEYLLNDDLKIAYNSCAILSNLTSFPKNIEKRIYSEKNIQNILKFYYLVINNISSYSEKTLILILNVAYDKDMKIYLIKHNFMESFFNFVNDIINNKIKFINDKSELETIYICVRIIQQLIALQYIDNNYMKYFTPFINNLKIISAKYYLNIDIIAFSEEECKCLISIWNTFIINDDESKININEIVKDSFTKILIGLYKRIKDVEWKINIIRLFCAISYVEAFDIILFNDGLVTLLNEQIEKYQYSNVALLRYLIFCASNFATGNIFINKAMYDLGIINRIMDITIFYIDDKIDSEILYLLKYCLQTLIHFINGCDQDCKKKLITYKNYLIVKILSKALRLELKEFVKSQMIESMIININELCIASEEFEENQEKEFDMALISNSIIDILSNLYNKSFNEQFDKEIIIDVINFIKDKEKSI